MNKRGVIGLSESLRCHWVCSEGETRLTFAAREQQNRSPYQFARDSLGSFSAGRLDNNCFSSVLTSFVKLPRFRIQYDFNRAGILSGAECFFKPA